GEVRANGPRIWELTTSDLGEDHGETVLYLPDGGSSQALIDDAPEGPKVSAIVDLSLAFGLLWAHVRGRSEERAFTCEPYIIAGRASLVELGEPEVDDLGDDVPVGVSREEDVLGFEIAVHDARFMGFGEPARDVTDDVEHAWHRHLP